LDDRGISLLGYLEGFKGYERELGFGIILGPDLEVIRTIF
jgi:hypothetical protein